MTENINWYPGHMKKTRELIRDNLKLVDAVIEVLDSRIPYSSKNPIIDDLVGDKPRVIALNKSDLSDASVTEMWVSYLEKSGRHAVKTNANKGDGVRKLVSELGLMRQKKYGEENSRKAYRLMIVGVPNSGKSSLINRLMNKKSTQVGNRPGVTKGKQWLTLANGMQLLDTPGILWPKFEDPETGKNLAFCGSIKDEILDTDTLGLELIGFLQDNYEDILKERYKLSFVGDTHLETMEAIAKKRGFILSGGRTDYTRTAKTVLDEFRNGIIGRISLERP